MNKSYNLPLREKEANLMNTQETLTAVRNVTLPDAPSSVTIKDVRFRRKVTLLVDSKGQPDSKGFRQITVYNKFVGHSRGYLAFYDKITGEWFTNSGIFNERSSTRIIFTYTPNNKKCLA